MSPHSCRTFGSSFLGPQEESARFSSHPHGKSKISHRHSVLWKTAPQNIPRENEKIVESAVFKFTDEYAALNLSITLGGRQWWTRCRRSKILGSPYMTDSLATTSK